MIVKKMWIERIADGVGITRVVWQGWFLFGFIPLYVAQLSMP